MRFRMEKGWYDFELELFRDVASPLDKRLKNMYEADVEEADRYDYNDTAEQYFGVGLVTAQIYINSCIAENTTSYVRSFSDSDLLKCGPKHSSGISLVKLMVHGANYWKHCDEWDPKNDNCRRDRILNTFSSIGISEESTLYSLLEEICGKPKPLLGDLIPILEEWHNAVEEC